MKRYSIKCEPGRFEYLDVLRETDEGYVIRITKMIEGNEKILEESMSRHLFNLCIKTGFISEMEKSASSVA